MGQNCSCLCSLALQERQDDRIQLIDATVVLHVGIDLVAQADVQRELRMHAPVVLCEEREVRVVGIRDQQRLRGMTAAQRHGKQQIVVVDSAIAVAIEIRKVFDQFDSTLLKYSQIKIRIDSLKLAAESERVIAAQHRECDRQTVIAFVSFLAGREKTRRPEYSGKSVAARV